MSITHPSSDLPDFSLVFDALPRSYLLIDTRFMIIAQNQAHATAVLMKRNVALGRLLFEVFPDNPEDYSADGVSHLRASLLRVIKTRQPDQMSVQKYDIQRLSRDGGNFETHYWRVLNVPILDQEGYVKWILNCPEDVTEFVTSRKVGAKIDKPHSDDELMQP
jgi:PAS domain-containing protein